MPGGLLTDLYEITMADTYLRSGMTGRATFSLFVRALPRQRGFLVAAGLEPCLEFLERFSFEPAEIAFLEDRGIARDTLEALSALRFTGDVWAVPEGTVVLADEPILEVTAPIVEGQLVETYLLNQVTFQTALASKAVRCVIAARGRDVIDFAFRRTHGIEAAMTFARVSAIAGFAATSNVEAARRYGLRATGTMAHSFVEAFPSEEDAFRAFARDHPSGTTFLVDTYDTLQGVRNAALVIKELALAPPLAIRLDSGNLDRLSRDARAKLDHEGLHHVRIFASGGLDEYALEDLVQGGAPIDGFGVGTKAGVSADAPALDSAYKLVAYDGRPVVKLSTGKETYPGAKQVWRAHGPDDDVLCLREEPPPSPNHRGLLEPVMAGGRRLRALEPIDATRERLWTRIARLPESALRVREPEAPTPAVSESLRALALRARDAVGRQRPGPA